MNWFEKKDENWVKPGDETIQQSNDNTNKTMPIYKPNEHNTNKTMPTYKPNEPFPQCLKN